MSTPTLLEGVMTWGYDSELPSEREAITAIESALLGWEVTAVAAIGHELIDSSSFGDVPRSRFVPGPLEIKFVAVPRRASE